MVDVGKEWNYNLESQHLSGNPKIFGKDIDLQRRMAFEAMFSVGITVEYYRCREELKDIYKDPECKWDDKVLMSAIFSDNPSIKILKNLGWYNEDEEIRAPIIYLPIYKDWTMKEVFDIKDNSLIKVHYFGQNKPSEFRITDKKMDSVYGMYWICKLAPERLEDFYTITDNGTHYLKRSTDRGSSCSHKINDTGENERTYNHRDYENNILDSSDEYSSLVMRNK